MSLGANANSTNHYTTLILGVFIGLIGVYLRFFGEGFVINAASNIILIIGVIIAIRKVFAIIK